MAWNGTVLDFGRKFADGNRIDDLSRQPAARRHGFGRSASSQARACVLVARYERRPPWRATSRLTVEAERLKLAAMR